MLRILTALSIAPVAFLTIGGLQAASIYSQNNLVSDLPGVATHLDPNLVNPWGIAFSATSPFWIADNGSGLSTLYNGAGTPQSLVVTIPTPPGGTPPSAPTGVVFAGGSGFTVPGGAAASFIFSTENGTIAAWAGALGTNAALEVNDSASGAVFKGLALANNGTGNFLYATNFNSGQIDVFNSSFAPVTLAANFTDPNLPAGYAPFDIEVIGGKLYVTYALQDTAKHDDVAGPGNGFVDVFDLNGNFLQRLVSNGPLDSPWGLALAPLSFGSYGGDLLVGNFGNGMINAFDPTTGAFLGTLSDSSDNPLVIQGLWGLAFGNGAQGTSTSSLYFTAGIPGPGGAVEDHGLFGSIQAAPEPGTIWLLAAAGLVGLCMRKKRSA